MSEVILPKAYDHTAKDIWTGCGFNAEEMNNKLQIWTPSLNENSQPTKMIQFIENLDIGTREKIALAYYVCGILASTHFERTMKEITALTAATMNQYRTEIKRLGGSTNPAEFGKKAPAKKRRVKK